MPTTTTSCYEEEITMSKKDKEKRTDSGSPIKSKMTITKSRKSKPYTENGRKKTIWDHFKEGIFGKKK